MNYYYEQESRKAKGRIKWAVVITFIFAIIRACVNLISIFSILSPHYPPYIIVYIFAESGIMIFLAVSLSKQKRRETCATLVFYYAGSRILILVLLYLHGFFIISGLAADVFVVVLYSLLMLPGITGTSLHYKIQNGLLQPPAHMAQYYYQQANPYQQPQPNYPRQPNTYQQPQPNYLRQANPYEPPPPNYGQPAEPSPNPVGPNNP